jgi:hypothetical protein
VGTLVVDPHDSTVLYAGTQGGGVFKSVDEGRSWAATNNGLSHTIIRSLIVHPVESSSLFVGTDGGVFKSTDGGEQWETANEGLLSRVVNALAIDPRDPKTLYAGIEVDRGGFVAAIDASGGRLLYSRSVAGSPSNRPHGIAVDALGNAYVSGWTTSEDSHLSTIGFGRPFLAKIAAPDKPPPPPLPESPPPQRRPRRPVPLPRKQ